MPNSAWDDPSTSHGFHPPLHAPTPPTPDLEDLTRGADALQQMIKAAKNMGDGSDDLGIFHIQKAEASKLCQGSGLNPQTKQMIKPVNGYHRTCCRTCVTGAFRRARIVVEYDPTHSALVARVDRTQASNIRHWNLDKTRIKVDTLGNTDKYTKMA
jgi:hypothetical protein